MVGGYLLRYWLLSICSVDGLLGDVAETASWWWLSVGFGDGEVARSHGGCDPRAFQSVCQFQSNTKWDQIIVNYSVIASISGSCCIQGRANLCWLATCEMKQLEGSVESVQWLKKVTLKWGGFHTQNRIVGTEVYLSTIFGQNVTTIWGYHVAAS